MLVYTELDVPVSQRTVRCRLLHTNITTIVYNSELTTTPHKGVVTYRSFGFSTERNISVATNEKSDAALPQKAHFKVDMAARHRLPSQGGETQNRFLQTKYDLP